MAFFKNTETYVFDAQAKYKSNSLLILHKGKIVSENYKNGFKPEQKQRLWSITKSFAATLVGRAERLGILTRDDLVKKYFPEVKDQSVTIKNLLQMSSGIDWAEGYEASPFSSDVIAMLYYRGHGDMTKDVLAQKFAYKPGEHFNYSSGETNLLMGILKKALGQKPLRQFLEEELFNPLQVENYTWETDGAGTFVGSSYLYMSARDLAKLGELYLNGGLWNGKPLLPLDWVSFSTTLTPSFEKTTLPEQEDRESYGAHWWLNKDLPLKKKERAFPAGPQSLFMGLGHHGQILMVLPEENIVLVRTAQDKEEGIDKNKLLKALFKDLKEFR
jgi:CubicO group peptidase (beta-lactamase class C family)